MQVLISIAEIIQTLHEYAAGYAKSVFWRCHACNLTAFSCLCSTRWKIVAIAKLLAVINNTCKIISNLAILVLEYFHGSSMKIYLHKHLTHKYFHTRKFRDLHYFTPYVGIYICIWTTFFTQTRHSSLSCSSQCTFAATMMCAY